MNVKSLLTFALVAASTSAFAAPVLMLDGAVVEEGASVESASSITVSLPSDDYDHVFFVAEKEVWNEPWAEGEEGYYSYEGINLVYDELTWEPVAEHNADGSWTAYFEKQPQSFYEGINYRVRVIAANTNGDTENWYDYDNDRFTFTFVGATEGKEPVDIYMGWPDVTYFSEPIAPADFRGVEISFPMNNLEEAIGDTDGWNYGAVALEVTEAYLYKEVNGEFDTENPIAQVQSVESDYEPTSVTVFNNSAVRAALEPASHYMVYVPGIILFDQFLWETIWEAGMLEQVVVWFDTTSETQITNVRVEGLDGVMFNLAGQRVSRANGMVITNGKKAFVK